MRKSRFIGSEGIPRASGPSIPPGQAIRIRGADFGKHTACNHLPFKGSNGRDLVVKALWTKCIPSRAAPTRYAKVARVTCGGECPRMKRLF